MRSVLQSSWSKPKAFESIFIDYVQNLKEYRLLILETNVTVKHIPYRY